MSRVIWKFPLTQPVMDLDVGPSAQVLTVATQHGIPCLWIELDPSDLGERRTYLGHGTGHPVWDGEVYLGTAHDVEGQGLVFHIYERVPARKPSYQAGEGHD